MKAIPTTTRPIELPEDFDLPPIAAAKLRRMDPALRATILPTELNSQEVQALLGGGK